MDKIPNNDDPTREAMAKAIGDPVAVRGLSQTKAATYGAGLAPFFLGLATWIGAFVLFLLLRPLSRRALAAGQSALRVALGGWLPGALLGVVQVLVMFSVVRFVVDIEPSNPFGTFGFLVLMSLTFVAILHALNAAFGAVGKFLGLILLILQLVSAGGTFPWQTIPVPLYPLHYGLPMGYAVDGLRHLMYGGDLGSVGTGRADPSRVAGRGPSLVVRGGLQAAGVDTFEAEAGARAVSARTTATKQKLFDAALKLVGERGAASVTVDEIAAEAGVAKGTIYYNFASKDALVEALLRHGVEILAVRLRSAEALRGLAGGAGRRDARLLGRVPGVRPAAGLASCGARRASGTARCHCCATTSCRSCAVR